MTTRNEKSHWRRSEAIANAPPLDEWPEINLEILDDEKKEQTQNKVSAIRQYIQGCPILQIKTTTGIHPSSLPEMLRRCLMLAGDGRIMGFRALLPNVNLAGYNRSKDFGLKRSEQKGGFSGALTVTLRRFPDIEKNLVTAILKEQKRLEIPEYRIRPKDLHRIFLKCLKIQGVKTSDWPFNTKFLGVRSIQRYMSALLAKNFARAVTSREERAAIAHMQTGRGYEPLLDYEQPFDAVELDAYFINAFFSVEFDTPDGTSVEVLIDRLWLLAMIDRVSSAVLGYIVVYSSEVSADDVLKLLGRVAGSIWKPLELKIPGLRYPVQGGLPSGLFHECEGAQWSVLLVDGALAHLSNAVHQIARRQLGFILNWGPIGHFERRPNIERLFKQTSDDVFLRLPSTTGSNPGKGRAVNAEENAVRYRIHAADVDQMLDVTFAQFNATPTEGLYGLSPLEFIDQHLKSERFNFMFRHLPMSSESSKSLIVTRRECIVRGGQHSGRRPYIQVDRGKYTSPVLATSSALVGHKLIIEYDHDDDGDYRQVKAFLSNGAELGILSVVGKWSKTRHSRRTRLAINRLLSRRILVWSEFDDPIRAYLNFLSKPTGKSKGSKSNTPSPQNAMLATKVAHNANLPLIIGESREETISGISIYETSSKSSFGSSNIDLDKIINRRR